MALTTLPVRQFFQIASEYGNFNNPASTYVVTGSVSRLLVDGGRSNLAADSFTMNTNQGSVNFTSGGPEGWWPSPDISAGGYGVIVGGNDGFANSTPDGRTSTVSCWGWPAGEDQATNDAEFIALTEQILNNPSLNTTASCKSALQSAGYYYQYPVGYQGQSPSTGPGSDS